MAADARVPKVIVRLRVASSGGRGDTAGDANRGKLYNRANGLRDAQQTSPDGLGCRHFDRAIHWSRGAWLGRDWPFPGASALRRASRDFRRSVVCGDVYARQP